MELLHRTLKKSSRLKVTRKKSLLDIVARERVELEIIQKELGVNKNRKANNRSEKVQKSQVKRLMTGVGANKMRGADGEKCPILPRASDVDFEDVPEVTTSSKLALKFLKKKVVKGGSAFGTMTSWAVDKTIKRRRVDPLAEVMRAKVVERRPFEEDELRAVEDRVRPAACKGIEELSASTQLELSKMEGKAELENGKVELEWKVVRLKSDLALEGERLDAAKVTQKVLISELTKKASKNLDDVVVQRDRLGHQFLVTGYTKANVKFIMAKTYIEEDEGENDVLAEVGVVIGNYLQRRECKLLQDINTKLVEQSERQHPEPVPLVVIPKGEAVPSRDLQKKIDELTAKYEDVVKRLKEKELFIIASNYRWVAKCKSDTSIHDKKIKTL
ncbi:hypothetical protein GIB67_039063, partial [Kingdonia uniflora]